MRRILGESLAVGRNTDECCRGHHAVRGLSATDQPSASSVSVPVRCRMASESQSGHSSRVFAHILASDRGKIAPQSGHSIVAFVSMSGSTPSRGSWCPSDSPVISWRRSGRGDLNVSVVHCLLEALARPLSPAVRASPSVAGPPTVVASTVPFDRSSRHEARAHDLHRPIVVSLRAVGAGSELPRTTVRTGRLRHARRFDFGSGESRATVGTFHHRL